MSEPIILITGATGNIGTAAVQLLAGDVHAPRVRLGTRDPGSARARLLQRFAPEQVEAVRVDVDDPDGLEQACAGITRLLVIAPVVPDMAGWHARVAAAARAAGTCEHVVKVSVTGARAPDSDPPPGRFPALHYQGEQALTAAGLPLTVIRPTIFMQHFLDMPALYTPGDDAFYLPTGEAGIAFLDCRDIARFAVDLLALDAAGRAPHLGQAYELSGPAAITAAEIARILSDLTERPVHHVDGQDAFIQHAAAIGASPALLAVYAEAAGGWFTQVQTEPFTAVTGRRPRAFAEFAVDHAAHFHPR